MDARMAPPSPSSAVSGLMQQLKSGEISKMQLFQQIARLQGAASSTKSTPVAGAMAAPPQSTPSFHSVAATATSMIFGSPAANLPSPASTAPFVLSNYSPPRSKSHTGNTPQPKNHPATNIPPQPTTRVGASPLLNDADILSSGVSHDKAQRLSVQEWMASKTRSTAVASAPLTFGAPTNPGAVNGFPFAPSPRGFGQGQQPVATRSSATVAPSSTGPSLFSFLHPQPHSGHQSTAQMADQSSSFDTEDVRQASVPSGDLQHGSSQWNQSPSAGPADERYEDDDHNAQQTNEYLHFDPFRDVARNADDGSGGGGTGGKSKRIDGGDEAKFHTRVTRWKSQKDAIREQMKQQLLQSELDECTFTPKVNPKSTKVVAKLRGRQRSLGGGNGENDCGAGGAGGATAGGFAVSERLYQEADIYKVREELAAKLKYEEEAELQRECTFKPKINKNNPITEKVKPKYMEINKKDTPVLPPAAMEAAAKELEECTFNPKVNPISQEMVSAQLYLQQNIYERLSRPCIASGDNTPGRDGGDGGSEYTEDMDEMASPLRARFHTQDDMFVRSRRRQGSSVFPRQQQREGSRPKSAGGIVTDEEKAERAKQFEDFLERQHFHAQSRKKKLEVTQQQFVQSHRPSINKKSLMMMENGRKGDFLERITKYAIRKEQDTVKNKTVLVSDPHCTFKPTINAHSSKRNARSVTELSRGDLLRRETTQRLMKLKMEQEEMASLTFRPQLSRASQRVEGRLKILTSPDTYLQRIQQQSQAHNIKQRRAIQEKEMEEFSECTFKPRTIEAPAYVQRIARSVVLTKALKKQQEATVKANQKPEWK